VVDPMLDRDDEARGHEPDPRQSPHGDSQEVSLHWRNTAEDETGMTEICTMPSTTEMHTARLKTSSRSASALNRSSMKKGTMSTLVPIMSNLTDSVLLKGGGAMQEESRLFPMT
jgi:hypothetical protein